jgi:N-methylhydantoinase B
MNGVDIEILWSNLRGVVTEQARSLQRTAFSVVVRESGDLAYAIFDTKGRMVAQAETGTPGHINSLVNTGRHLVDKFSETMSPGDVIITNDPWLGAGHYFDITIFMPIFNGDKLIAYVGSTCHHVDIGGLGVGAAARDVHEEGLCIPPSKLQEGGKPNDVLYDIIRANVRMPEHVFGDLAAQISGGLTGGEAIVDLCRRNGLSDIDELSDEIITRSEKAMRDAIHACPAGHYLSETRFDIPGGEVVTIAVDVFIDSEKGEILVDFEGSTPQLNTGVNVVFNYTSAYTTFAIRSCITPDLPNNSGSLSPIKVKAPLGSVVNCVYPAPVAARHIVGMYVPMPILKALFHALPARVVAEGAGALWSFQVFETAASAKGSASTSFVFSGGMGARANKAGLSAVGYPTGVGSMPLEMLEAETPVVFRTRKLRLGSGGAGRQPGGDGQEIEFEIRGGAPCLLTAVTSGLSLSPAGLNGGASGRPGILKVNGEDVRPRGKLVLNPGDRVYAATPGGGGYG